jgi:hypothetical protein
MKRDELSGARRLPDTDNSDGETITTDAAGEALLRRLVEGSHRRRPHEPAGEPVASTVVGTIMALTEQGRVPLVVYPRMPGVAALRARSAIDLDARHIGHSIILNFDGGDPLKPLVVGRLIHEHARAPEVQSSFVDLDVDGEALIISAGRRVVIRCGRASIALDANGQVTIRGESIISEAVGANHVRGGSVQLN